MDGGSWHCAGDREQDHPQEKEMQKSKMAVWGGLTNSHLHIWGYWYFSWQSWFQFVFLPVQRFSWYTLQYEQYENSPRKPKCLPSAGFASSPTLLFIMTRDKLWASKVALVVKTCLPMQETWVRSLDWEDPLVKEMATHSSILAWKIPWMEPGRLQSIGSQRVGHD